MTIDYLDDNGFFFRRDLMSPLREMTNQRGYGNGIISFLAPCFEI